MDEISCVLIKRNKRWFNYALPIIKDTYDNKIKALRTLSRIQKLKDNMNDIGFKVTVDVITEL